MGWSSKGKNNATSSEAKMVERNSCQQPLFPGKRPPHQPEEATRQHHRKPGGEEASVHVIEPVVTRDLSDRARNTLIKAASQKAPQRGSSCQYLGIKVNGVLLRSRRQHIQNSYCICQLVTSNNYSTNRTSSIFAVVLSQSVQVGFHLPGQAGG